jgi:hypothetical protein
MGAAQSRLQRRLLYHSKHHVCGAPEAGQWQGRRVPAAMHKERLSWYGPLMSVFGVRKSGSDSCETETAETYRRLNSEHPKFNHGDLT